MPDLAREIVASLDGLLRDRGVTATVEPGPDGADAHADRGQVSRALRNLVTNAIQHSAPGGSVRIGVSRASGVEVRVADVGPGIADEDVPYIFERFYRADRSRGRMPGSGIGLTVARELIVANGGTVEVESTGPAGTTFRVTLPAAD